MVIEMRQVLLDTFTVAVDQALGERQEMKVLVPGLTLESRGKALGADVRMSRIHEGEPPHSGGGEPRDRRCDRGADVVADDDGTLESEHIEELEHVTRERLLVRSLDRIGADRFGGSEAEEVQRDPARDRRRGRKDVAVVKPEARPAVQKDARGPVAGGDVVKPSPAQSHELLRRLPARSSHVGCPWLRGTSRRRSNRPDGDVHRTETGGHLHC